MKKSEVSIMKPDLFEKALKFGEAGQKKPIEATSSTMQEETFPKQKRQLKTASKQVSGLVPEGDVRLTANISEEHHIKLKVAAAQQRTTIGELIEQLIDKSL